MAEVLARGLRFHVQRLGRGARAVVFLHGLVMDNLSSWYFSVANPVAQRTEVLLYDLRGHGKSERPPGGYGVDDMVADLAALLDALELERVDLCGNSFGGLLAVAFALAWPERAGRLLLVDPHMIDDRWGAEMRATLGLQGEEAIGVIASRFAAWKGRHSARKRNRLALNARELIYGTSLVDDLVASPPFSAEQLAGLRSPVLALYGESSDIRARGERMLAAVPDLDLRILSGCSHSILWERTELLKELVVAWAGGGS